MVRASGVAHAEGVHAQVAEGFHPGLEDGLDRGVLLHINAADLTRAVVHVEINGDLFLLGLESDGTVFAAQQRGISFALRVLRFRPLAEMMHHVPLRAQQSFFLTAPQPDADGARAFKMRTASIITTVPAPLSVAPV